VDTLLSVTADRGVIRQSESGRRDSSSADKSLYWDVHPGDVVYNTMRMWQGVSGIASEAGIVSPAYTVCEPVGEVSSEFLRWFLKDPRLVGKFFNRSQGLVSDTWNLTYSEFKKIEVELPPLAEQCRAAEVLDEFDAQIQRTQIEALKLGDLSASVLDAKLRVALEVLEDAEVSNMADRIGQAVGCFRFVNLGSLLTSIDTGHSPDLEDKPAGSGQWGVLKVSAVGREGFRSQENKRVEVSDLIDASIEVRQGDLLMTRANTPELVGLSCVVNEVRPGLMLSDKTLRLNIAHREGDPYFLNALLRQPVLRRQIEIAATGTSSSMKNISQESIRGLVVPWVDPSMQNAILAPVVAIQGKRDRLECEVVKLKSVEKALMSDLFAGRVRIPVAS
jgi:type I restriction enzyme S subunit